MRQLTQQLAGLVARGRVLFASSGGKGQTLQLQLLADETKELEHVEPFGFTACPEAGAEAVALFIGGDRSHGIVLQAGDRRYRISGLKPGETAVYNADGAKIVLKKGKVIEVECDVYRVKCKTYDVAAAEGATFDTPTLTSSGDIADQGGASTMAAMRATYNQHDHDEHDTGTTHKPNQEMP